MPEHIIPNTEALNKDAPSGVLIGQDGYLFLAGGAHKTRELYTGVRKADEKSVRIFNENTDRRTRFCQERNIRFIQVVFPDKMVALADMTGIPEPLESLYLRDYAPAAVTGAQKAVLYPLKLFRGRRDLFDRTDTHYSALGRLTAAREICRPLGEGFAEALTRNTKVYRISEDGEVTGDLGKKFAPPRSEQTHVLHSRGGGFVTRGSNRARQGNDGIMDMAENLQSVSDKTLLIFGDSFLRGLHPILLHIFRRVVFCRTRFFHPELVAAVSPDVIVCGAAERYLSACGSDLDRLHFLSYTFASGRGIDPTDSFSALWEVTINREKLLGSWDF